jgi:hypothetical protein
MTKAFILEPCSLNVSTAATFGELVYVFDKGERRSSIWAPAFRQEIIEALERKDFDPDRDYFVVAGHMVPLVIAVSVLQEYYGYVKTLMFCSVSRGYTNYILGKPHETTGSENVSTGESHLHGHSRGAGKASRGSQATDESARAGRPDLCAP